MDQEVPYSITRSIDIDAPAERVWELVSEPGWFINDGEYRRHRIERDGDVSTVHDPVHGAFVIRTVSLEPPRHAAFRWLAGTAASSAEVEELTFVEFRIEDRDGGGVRLTVVESGFASLEGGSGSRSAYDENSAGWDEELRVAMAYFSGA